MFRSWMMTALLVPTLGLSGCGQEAPATAGLPGEQVAQEGGPPPNAVALWPAPKDVADRIAAARVAMLTEAFQSYHLHLHLEVWKDGEQVVVPASIGIAPDESYHSPIHTHTPSGVVHVESPVVEDFTIGQIFTLWGVSLAGATVTVDGQVVPDPANAKLANLQLITVRFGDR